MESFASTIVVFGIFALLCQIANITFLILDQRAKEDYRWFWVVGALFLGPILLIPYWFWGRER